MTLPDRRRQAATAGGVFFVATAALLILMHSSGWGWLVPERETAPRLIALPIVFYLILLLLGISLLIESRYTIFMLAFYSFLLFQRLLFTVFDWLPALSATDTALLLVSVIVSLTLLYTDIVKTGRTPQIVSGFMTAVLFNLLLLYYLG
jgi:hypothetical protein